MSITTELRKSLRYGISEKRHPKMPAKECSLMRPLPQVCDSIIQGVLLSHFRHIFATFKYSLLLKLSGNDLSNVLIGIDRRTNA